MTQRIERVGALWLADQVDSMDDHIVHVGPVEFNETYRYLPAGVTPRPGYISFDLFPFFREILECFDKLSPVREVNLRKGVQVGATTLLESILFYYIVHLRTHPGMYLTADNDLAKARMDNNILPMLVESGFADRIRSADIGNTRKTGKTSIYLQWVGGGYLIYCGALNAGKMRQTSVPFLLKDELDGWKVAVGNDGNSDSLTNDRASAYWDVRKIFRASTPLTKPSMIDDAFKRGDQRVYMVRCKSCGFPQELKFRKPDPETGIIGGFRWELENKTLIHESVRYCCVNCGEAHFEHDKERLFDDKIHGAHWLPTGVPAEPNIRSYHLPAFYSPYGFRPWYKCVADFLDAFDPETQQVISMSKYQTYYNNVLGKAFTVMGSQVRFRNVSNHRRACYRMGQIPNQFALAHSGSKIVFLVCVVDVHVSNLAVAVMGFTVGSRPYLVDYWRFDRTNDDDDCSLLSSPVWTRLREVIENSKYEADDGQKYGIAITFIDASFANASVVEFCAGYSSGVYPILGRDRPSKHQRIQEFAMFTTQGGTVGFRIVVDHYKDRMAPALRRMWDPEMGGQPEFHFNAPVDTTDKQLTELTVERRRDKTDDKGNTTYYWYRPGNARNELWDLLGYSYAAVDIFAWLICRQHFELETIPWPEFWAFAQEKSNDGLFCRLA